ncbi:hypothetical protein DL769_008710 [Monosporascus sp. CRB-8-3]|nr:hypothetical protein DL769_008710 [Monosporascus sp. CRB-8-3]
MDFSNLNTVWGCDGRDLTGNPCKNTTASGHGLYHCIFCVNHDFCKDCIKLLRDPEPAIEIPGCGAGHRWLRIPPLGGEMYVGSKAKSVRVPKEVKASKEDEMILDIHYAEGENDEITVTAWKKKLAAEWDISLEEIRKEAQQTASDSDDESEK